MESAIFNLTAYCQRIGYTGELRADLATVQALMQHQLRSVPFENLDVLAGKPISLRNCPEITSRNQGD
ncbi:MAG: arylamine N-acetyltransferase [Candidatus Thiothrix putei]|uniref:Arylamine N-acetyltransferase n=1 Tax=Candidatus Thiothrix putei TaxID=3080811 RepID=A0AA95HCB9_9GAMM|nr:MAG: arylamine N-acetyltransferase [Candidatus Thiothrix putei]